MIRGIVASTVVRVGRGLVVPTWTADPAATAAPPVFVAGGVVVDYGPFERYAGFSSVALALLSP